MHQTTPQPETGKDSKLSLIEQLNATVTDCNKIVHSTVTKCTITLEGEHHGERFKKQFNFTDGTVIPAIELKMFFHSYMSRLADAAFKLVDTEEKFLQLGNDIISVKNFLKDYSQGNYPSINATDYLKVQNLEVNQVAVITINKSIQSVKRIS